MNSSFTILNAFDLFQWKKWIENLIFEKEIVPNIPAGDREEEEALIFTFNNLQSDSAKENFKISLINVLQTLPLISRNSYQIYVLLYVSQRLKPNFAKSLFKKIIFEERLLKIKYRNLNLHFFMLQILTDIILLIDNENEKQEIFKEQNDIQIHIFNIIENIEPVNYSACIKILGKFDKRLSFDFTDQVLSKANEHEIKLIYNALIELAHDSNYREFYFWFKNKSQKAYAKKIAKEKTLPSERIDIDTSVETDIDKSFQDNISKPLKQIISSTSNKYNDPYLILLSTLLHLNESPISAEEIILVANTYNTILGDDKYESEFILKKIFSLSGSFKYLYFWIEENYMNKIGEEIFEENSNPIPYIWEIQKVTGPNIFGFVTHWKFSELLNSSFKQKIYLDQTEEKERNILKIIRKAQSFIDPSKKEKKIPE